MKHATEQADISAIKHGKLVASVDRLAIEEPLEIVLAFYRDGSIQRQSLSVTMRTPGDDFDLVRGFLYCEGIIRDQSDVLSIAHRGRQALQSGVSNVVMVSLAPHVAVDIARLQRHFLSSSACGVCGKTTIEALENAGAQPILHDSFSIGETKLMGLPEIARQLQGIYEQTGGTHAAAAFDTSGHITCLREDVGRHNALDKLIGALSHNPALPGAELGLLVSGRASFELLQKAAMAGFAFFVAVGAPSSLAAALAREFEITLLGFVRKDRFTIYNRPDRVRLSG